MRVGARRRCATCAPRVGLVFQDPDDQLFMPTVREDVAFGPLNLGLARDGGRCGAWTDALAAVRMERRRRPRAAPALARPAPARRDRHRARDAAAAARARRAVGEPRPARAARAARRARPHRAHDARGHARPAVRGAAVRARGPAVRRPDRGRRSVRGRPGGRRAARASTTSSCPRASTSRACRTLSGAMHRPEDRSAPPIGQRSLPADDLAAAKQLVALSHDLMGAVDAGRRLVWTNPAWKALLGWEPEELAGVVYSDLLHPDDRDTAAAAERALLAGAGRWSDAEFRVRTRTGDYRWVLWSGVAAPGQGLLYISGKDVSARNEAIAERALVHARYRALVGNLPGHGRHAVTTPTCGSSSRRARQLARRGLDPAAYAGRLLSETMPAEQLAKIEPHYRAALAGEPQAFDVDTLDGAVTYRVQAVPLYDAGRPAGRRHVGQPRRHRAAAAGAGDRRTRRGARALQPGAGPVRLRRVARPVRAAADDLQLPPAPAPPLPRQARRGRRRVHRLRRRGRRADAER